MTTAETLAGHISTREIPQTEPIPGKVMVPDHDGGYVFAVTPRAQLDRFLILGSQGGTYYAAERAVTREGAACVTACLDADAPGTVARVVEVSLSGHALRNTPAVMALALASVHPNMVARQLAYASLAAVCRTGTDLFQFAAFRQALGGWGRGVRRAVADWYLSKKPDQLSYQLMKYQSREGWSHRDLLRLSHPKTKDDPTRALLDVTAHPAKIMEYELPPTHEAYKALLVAKTAREVADIIAKHRAPREVVPTQWLTAPEVWQALLDAPMPMRAMLRNLGNMSKVGLLALFSDASKFVISRLGDVAVMRLARVHPMHVLLAQRTYAQGHGERGGGAWAANPNIVEALEDAFYAAFESVEPTGRRHMLAVDVSSSMTARLAGYPISSAECAALMAMVVARREPDSVIVGFAYRMRDLGITKKDSMAEACRKTQLNNFGSTNCAVAVQHARASGFPIDAFVVITDSEANYGQQHTCQALGEYRRHSGLPAKLAVVATCSNEFSIADPADAGMLDIVGFTPDFPAVLAGFVRGH